MNLIHPIADITIESQMIVDSHTIDIRNAKLNDVRKFIKENCNLAPQGSEEWLKTRQSIIGGSELSILIGKNPFSSIADLVATKCNLVKYSGNVATRWGTIFEEMTRIIVQMLFVSDIPLNEECIYETGSLEGVIPHHRFSPDGLTVIICRTPNGQLQPLIVLLEFKSPLSSLPTGVVPPYYLPQVKAGMCDIAMTEIGLFVNNMYRKCSLSQFGNNSQYNTEFHKSDIKKKVSKTDPLAIGILGLYQTKEQRHRMLQTFRNDTELYIDTSEDEATNDPLEMSIENRIINGYLNMEANKSRSNIIRLENLIDVGDLDEEDTLKIFQYICSKYITIKYYPPNIYTSRITAKLSPELVCRQDDVISFRGYENNPARFVQKFGMKCLEKDYIPIGYLPWKLFKADFILVDKDPIYIYQFVPKINEVIEIVNDICKVTNPNDRLLRYQTHFPSRGNTHSE